MIITPQEFADYRSDISQGWKKEENKIQRCIDEAERVDLYDTLGSFYFDLLDNRDESDWQPLLDGSTFDYQGKKYMHIGIKKYLAGLAFVRFITLSNTVHTPHGLVTKFNDNSEPVSSSVIRDIRKDVQVTNEIEFKRIDTYLKANKQLFPTYSTGNNDSIASFSIQATTLR